MHDLYRKQAAPRLHPNKFDTAFGLHYLCKDQLKNSIRDGSHSFCTPDAHPRRRPGNRYRQHDSPFRPPYQQATAFVLVGTVGRRDDLRFVRRTVPTGTGGYRSHLRPPNRDGYYDPGLFRRRTADRRHRPAGAFGREPARSPYDRRAGEKTEKCQTDAHGTDDRPGYRHPQLPGRHRHLRHRRRKSHAGYRHRRRHRHTQHTRRYRGFDPRLLRHRRPDESLPLFAPIGFGRARSAPCSPILSSCRSCLPS